MLTIAAIVSRSVLPEEPTCMATVRAMLYRGDELTITEMRKRSGDRWPAYVISAALAKLRHAGEIEVLPPIGGGLKGKRYVATAKLSPHLRCRPRGRAPGATGEAATAARSPVPHARRAGYWDNLVPAAAACEA